MSGIGDVHYNFEPDKQTRKLCESIATQLNGNGTSFSDITAESVVQGDVTINTLFVWQVDLKITTNLAGETRSPSLVIHKNVADAQTAIKKQGQEFLHNASGKIELVQNINEDPLHFFRHSSIKLNSGKTHGYIEHCQECKAGQVTCPQCKGKGTHKALTKKENFLGTLTNIDAKNLCPTCKGRGTVNCSHCHGKSELTKYYELRINAEARFKDQVSTDNPQVQKEIENFLSRTSRTDLVKRHIDPVFNAVENIDKNHCRASYQSKTAYTLLKLNIRGNIYEILGFGRSGSCISHPPILDELLLETVVTTCGRFPSFFTTRKYDKLQQMPVLKQAMDTDIKQRDEKIPSIIAASAGNLLSPTVIDAISKQIIRLRRSLVPSFCFASWILLLIPGIIAGIYFGLPQRTLAASSIVISVYILGFIASSIFISRMITSARLKKLKLKKPPLRKEYLPSAISALLIALSVLAPGLYDVNQRWGFYSRIQAQINSLKDTSSESDPVINEGLIELAQEYLKQLGYNNVTRSGNFDTSTAEALKDFQRRFGLRQTSYLDNRSIDMLGQYAALKAAFYKNNNAE